MLKWAKGCKFWQRKPFLQRFRDIVADKVCYRLLPKNEKIQLVSLNSVEIAPSQSGGSDDAVRGDPCLVGNLESVGSDMKAGCEEREQGGREAGKEKQKIKVENDYSSMISSLTQTILKELARISVLERRIVNLETLAATKGWEIEGMNDQITGKIHESCIEGDKDHTVEVFSHPKLSSITKSEKQGCRQYVKRKSLMLTSAKEHFMVKRRDIAIDQASIPSMEEQSSARIERKGTNILVNIDDYACPTEHKQEAKVTPLKYFGRELLTENIRKYLDAFCIKPMQRDDIVFFDWNICIRRQSMLEYLQGGYTGEEIIDAYALILYEGIKISE